MNGRFLNLRFNIQIDNRDGRYRIRFYDIMNHDYIFTKSSEPLETTIGRLNAKQQARAKDVLIDADNQFIDLLSRFQRSVTNVQNDDFYKVTMTNI